MKGAYWGSCIVIVGRHTTAGMPPFSFASLSQICPLQGRSITSDPHFVLAQGSRRRQDKSPFKAGLRSAGAKLTGVFLWYRPYYKAA